MLFGSSSVAVYVVFFTREVRLVNKVGIHLVATLLVKKIKMLLSSENSHSLI